MASPFEFDIGFRVVESVTLFMSPLPAITAYYRTT